MKTAFDGLFSRLDMAKERISELLVISMKASMIKKQTNRQTKRWTGIYFLIFNFLLKYS